MCEECDPFVPSFAGWAGHFPLQPDTHKPKRVEDFAPEQELRVNKATHRIRFENETESEVTVVIEPKESR